MNNNQITPKHDEVKCTKETLSKTILSLEKEFEILEINTITNYFGFFFIFKFILKRSRELNPPPSLI
jgi:hypothetical protein